ncbi:MAG: NAD(P)-dependent glycerol-1-phosphate dehydrogenase [Candidatus Hadarchaeia archaeon]
MKNIKQMELPRQITMGPGVLEKTPELVLKTELGKRGYLVVDETTYEVAGRKVENALKKSGIDAAHSVIENANEKTVTKIRDKARSYDFLMGIGGGKCIDVAKSASFKENKSFISVPTAASHDGISSSRASIKGGGRKTSVEAKPPMAVIADTLIIKDSPSKLTSAGCGDMIANYTAVLDWKLSRKEKNERYSEYAAALSKMSAKIVAENAEKIAEGEEEGARKIVKALISSGVAMSIASSSRPASGSEHLFSHALDRIAPKPALHGEQCAVGSIMMTKLHGKDWKSTRRSLKKLNCPTNAKELGIDEKYIIEALTKAHKIRPQRYTILKGGLSEEEARELAKETKVISA